MAVRMYCRKLEIASQGSVVAGQAQLTPGDKVLTRMPYCPHSWATERHICCTAALLELYAVQVRPWIQRVSDCFLAQWRVRAALLYSQYFQTWTQSGLCSRRFHS